ncbi:6-phospho-3-hexuloisomerase [Deinococcus petrolearius]|uniref:6-phospho-3-hexuloisomerase n=1 Tax=Deinococcus petrolearius TaxID=1751295 RepID=A0ABW1DQG4_9DEIO
MTEAPTAGLTSGPASGATSGSAADFLPGLLAELARNLPQIGAQEAGALAGALLGARRVFVAGAGRSGLMVRAFAMRLTQLGITAYVVGETTTPAVAPGDLLLVASGSGETGGLVQMARQARAVGAAVALVTLAPRSALGELAGVRVTLPGVVKDGADAGRSVQPMASLFEQTLLLFLDALVLDLMRRLDQTSADMYTRHANLE